MFQIYGTNFRSHQAQRPLGRACATVHAAAANAVRIHFRPVPRFAAAPPLSPNPWERHSPGCTAFPTGILPRASRICAQIRQTPAPLRQKAVPRILHPQHGLFPQGNISQACIWQIRSHAPRHVQTSPRLSFRRRTATSHPRAAFRARIPQNDFPALRPFQKTFLRRRHPAAKSIPPGTAYRPGIAHMHPRAPPRRAASGAPPARLHPDILLHGRRPAAALHRTPHAVRRGPVDPVPRQTPVPAPARDSLLLQCAARYFSDAGIPFVCAAAGPVPAGCPGMWTALFCEAPTTRCMQPSPAAAFPIR